MCVCVCVGRLAVKEVVTAAARATAIAYYYATA